MPYSMLVLKRDGRKETVSFDKVLGRVRKASKGLSVNPDALAQQVLAQIFDGVKTSELDELTAQLAASLTTLHPDYGTLAGRISVSNHHKNTTASFSEVMLRLSDQKMPQTGESTSFIHPGLLASIKEHGPEIDAKIHHDRDYLLDYFGFKTLERAYLLKDTSMVIQERPQHMWMRVALALWFNDLPRAFETYDYMSTKCFTHATPTLFNAGTPRQQLSSCFLLAMSDDSIQGIYKTLGDCAAISKFAGGIGLHLHNVRARGSLIKGTNGQSNGLVPMLRVFNNTARYVDQCFTPDTMIYTEAGVKTIEDVSITDKVLTSQGHYVRVNQPLRHTYSGPMLELRVKHSVTPIRVTPEHQVFALKGQKKMLNYDVIRNRIDKNLATVAFTDAKDLEVDDFVVFPIPTYECDIPSISEDDCRFYGILLGDGHISKDVAGVCLNSKTKQDTCDFVKTYLSNRGVTVNTYEDEETNTVRLKWSTSSPGFKFTASQIYDENHVKKMESCWLHLPLVKAKQIVKGLIETDGCIGTKEITLEVTSYHLIESLRYILLRLGALSSGYERNRVGNVSSYKNITTNLPSAVLRVPRIPEIMEMFPTAPAASWFNFMKHKGYLYTRIEEISESEYSGTVHDFEVEDPHDYTVAHLGITHNGGGKRNGSFAMYLEPWHADVEDFLKMRLNTGSEEERARDLFYALWIPDLFMERVEADGDWSLFCPNEAPGLADVWGDDFKALYERYEREGRARKVVKAQKLWFQVLDSQMETGTPYLLYKDAANRKSNQQNLGTIKSSNLCTEIIEYSNKEETAVCNLASLALPSFVSDGVFDYTKLREVTKVAIRNLNRVIDINFYPTPETERSNMRHRPVGLGVQGLADVFALLGLAWEQEEAAKANQLIFEHMYFAAVEASVEIAKVEGPYSTFKGSPASKGLLQPDLWSVKPITETDGSLDWAGLREAVKTHGLRNSLLIAPMPTASTSQILGFNECFEPFTSNLYTRRTLAGEFIVINRYLLADLMKAGLWSEDMKQQIVARNGSVQGIPGINEELQLRYKTSWEMKQKILIDMAAARGAFICQSQSLNLFVADPTYSKLTSMHFYAWKQGLKTGCYYLRTKAPVTAQKFTVDPRLMAAVQNNQSQVEGQNQRDDNEGTYDSESDSDDDSACGADTTSIMTSAEKKKALLDKLAAEYEAEVASMALAKSRGEEVCEMCSS